MTDLFSELIRGMELPEDYKISDEFIISIDAFYDKFMRESKLDLYPRIMTDALKNVFESNIPKFRELVCESYFKSTDRDNFVSLLMENYVKFANGETKLLQIMLCISLLADHIHKNWRFIRKDGRTKRTAEVDGQSSKRIRVDEPTTDDNGLRDNVDDAQTSRIQSAQLQLPTDSTGRSASGTVPTTITNVVPSKQPPTDPRKQLTNKTGSTTPVNSPKPLLSDPRKRAMNETASTTPITVASPKQPPTDPRKRFVNENSSATPTNVASSKQTPNDPRKRVADGRVSVTNSNQSTGLQSRPANLTASKAPTNSMSSTQTQVNSSKQVSIESPRTAPLSVVSVNQPSVDTRQRYANSPISTARAETPATFSKQAQVHPRSTPTTISTNAVLSKTAPTETRTRTVDESKLTKQISSKHSDPRKKPGSETLPTIPTNATLSKEPRIGSQRQSFSGTATTNQTTVVSSKPADPRQTPILEFCPTPVIPLNNSIILPMVDPIPVPETAQNVDQTADSNTEQPSSTNVAENDNHEKTGNTERRRVKLNVDPVIHHVAAHISDRFLDVGLRPYPTEVLTTNYNQHLFSNLSGLEEKINIGNVTDVPNGTVPYSYRIVPLPKSCEHSDWHRYNNGLEPKTVEDFIKILELFHCSRPRTDRRRLNRLIIHDMMFRPMKFKFMGCQTIDIGFPTSHDVYFKALKTMRENKENAYVIDRIYLSMGCDLVMRALNRKSCLDDVKLFLIKFFRELIEDFGPNGPIRYRSENGYESIPPKYPVVFIINYPIWSLKNSRIRNFNDRLQDLNAYLKTFVQEKSAFGPIPVELIDWDSISKEALEKDGYGSVIEENDAEGCLDVRYAVLQNHLLSIGELLVS